MSAADPLDTAKRAALAALAGLPPFEPVASVGYRSQGRLLIVGKGVRVAQAADALRAHLSIAVLFTGDQVALGAAEIEAQSGSIVSLHGHLGAFELQWTKDGRTAVEQATFDLVLDVHAEPLFAMSQPPLGYFHAADGDAFAHAVAALPEMVGEFEKPRYFAYKESICAHSRSRKIGCHRCIDICSTQAISTAGDVVTVDPHLCMGCGACATVCPTGAMRYQYPRVADRGVQLRAMLLAWRQHAARAPVIVFHHAAVDVSDLPAMALPLESWHAASIGIDVLLGAIAHGVAGVVIAADGREAPHYRAASENEMRLAETILHALGYEGKHFVWAGKGAEHGMEEACHALSQVRTVGRPASFHLTDDKRATIEFAIEHLLRESGWREEAIDLPPDSPFGAVEVDKRKCTLCLACAGACPASALMDGGAQAERPQLRFIERNCVQCGLCVNTCPENALSLRPRLLLSEARKREVVLNEDEPFHCLSCGKAIGTRRLIDNVLGKLAGHSLFQEESARRRLHLCADCRVVDMMSRPDEMSVLTGQPTDKG